MHMLPVDGEERKTTTKWTTDVAKEPVSIGNAYTKSVVVASGTVRILLTIIQCDAYRWTADYPSILARDSIAKQTNMNQEQQQQHNLLDRCIVFFEWQHIHLLLTSQSTRGISPAYSNPLCVSVYISDSLRCFASIYGSKNTRTHNEPPFIRSFESRQDTAQR